MIITTISSYVLAVTASFVLIISAILWKSSTKILANRIMAILLLLMASSLMESIANAFRLYQVFPHYFAISEFFPFLYGPLYLVYIELLLFRKTIRRSFSLHFIPFIVAFVSNYPFYTLGFAEKVQLADRLLLGIGSPIIVDYSEIMILVFGAYIAMTLYRLQVYRVYLKQVLADSLKYNLTWLFISTILLFLTLMSSIIWVFGSGAMVAVFFQAQSVFSALTMASIGYFSLTGVIVFHYHKNTEEFLPPSTKLNPEYSQNQPSGGFQSIAELVTENLKTSQIYLQPDLNLYQLANLVDVKPYLLSKSINSFLGCSFGELINEYRVLHFVALLQKQSQAKFTIESLIYDSGFQNKSTFYKAFLKKYHLTPKQYIAQLDKSV